MVTILKLLKNLLQMRSRMAKDKSLQSREGYSIEISGTGPERYITYKEDDLIVDVTADFSWSNDVVLYSDSLRKSLGRPPKSLSDLEFLRVKNRVINYLSCWGDVTIIDTELPHNEAIRRPKK